ncbi:MAG: helix-turn-helix transcriptional regulator [Kiritimatiellae bacterium]|nr:helix-turn-helix transcriptional regulator [Kiritimatiellia bacterium]
MSTRFRYFPQDNATSQWGLCLRSVGWQQTSRDSEYPLHRHPDGYYYTWDTGRRLSEYQICLVFAGSGIVEFERGKPQALSGGTLLLLSKGQWHRCRPDARTGWGTLWLGFCGEMAQPIVRSIFRPGGCVMRSLAKAREFKYAAMRFIAHVLRDGDRKPFSTVGDLVQLLGRLADGEFDAAGQPAKADAVRNAQREIARRYAETIDFKSLAESLGVSYDSFRHNFAAETGMSPLQFQLSERLRTAKNLVANSDMAIRDVARHTGFSSAAYFTRFFKEATKLPPTEYRRAQATE